MCVIALAYIVSKCNSIISSVRTYLRRSFDYIPWLDRERCGRDVCSPLRVCRDGWPYCCQIRKRTRPAPSAAARAPFRALCICQSKHVRLELGRICEYVYWYGKVPCVICRSVGGAHVFKRFCISPTCAEVTCAEVTCAEVTCAEVTCVEVVVPVGDDLVLDHGGKREQKHRPHTIRCVFALQCEWVCARVRAYKYAKKKYKRTRLVCRMFKAQRGSKKKERKKEKGNGKTHRQTRIENKQAQASA